MVDAPAPPPTSRPPKKAKVQTYAQRKRIEDLESRLFGKPGADPTADFGRELGGADVDGAPAAAPLLFFEDRRAGEVASDAGPSPSGRVEAPIPAAAGRRPRTRGGAATVVMNDDATPGAAPTPAAAAWHDPFVSAATVNVATGPSRLRKLRANESEAVLDGDAYEARLRSRFAATYENTGWAAAAKKAAAAATAAKAGAGQQQPGDGTASGAALLACGASLLARPAGAGPGGLTSSTAAAAPLAAGRLEITRLPDANAACPSSAVIQAVAFHPSGQLLLTAGLDKAVRFFQADGLAGAHLQTVHLRDCPVHSAAFARGGESVVVTGRRPFFYVLDLATGVAHRAGPLAERGEKSFESFAASTAPGADLVALLGDRGSLPLFSLRSRTPVGELRHSGTVRAAAFDPADSLGHTLLTAGGDGVVHEWDLRTRACVRRSVDEGALGVSALAASPGGSLAVGSTSGVVNVYRRGAGGALGPAGVGSWTGSSSNAGTTTSPPTAPATPTPAARPTPARALMNLTTSIDTLTWAASGAVLAIGSRLATDGLRLVHGGSLTVFPNWPTSRTPLGHVHAAAFSPGGGLLAAGTAKGRVLMYRLHDLPI